MWNKEEMLKSIDEYFENTTKDQFLNDLEETHSLDLVEDVEEKEGYVRFLKKVDYSTTSNFRGNYFHAEWNYSSLARSFLLREMAIGVPKYESEITEEENELLRIGA